MKKLKVWEWIATCLSIVGALLNAYQYISGFYVWFVADIVWILLGIKKKMWGLVATFVTFGVINLFGIYWWSR